MRGNTPARFLWYSYYMERIPDDPMECVDRRGPDECWPWLRGRKVHTRPTYRTVPAHRVIYELLVGPIPKGQLLHHECENVRCVNPAHMIPMGHAEHARRHPAKSYIYPPRRTYG